MRFLLFLIAFGNLGYLAFNLFSREAKVTSNPNSPVNNPTDDMAPVESLEPEPHEAIALPERFDAPQFSETATALNPSPASPSERVTADRSLQPPVSPIEVPSSFPIALPEFSLGSPLTGIPPNSRLQRGDDRGLEQRRTEIDRLSDPLSVRSTAPITVPEMRDLPALAPSLVAIPPNAQPRRPQVIPQGSARDLLPTPSSTTGRQASIEKQTDRGENANPNVEQSGLVPSLEEIQRLQQQLQDLEAISEAGNAGERSPGFTIAIPSGFGADNNTIYTSATFQNTVRNGDSSDGSLGLGIGLGNAERSVGVELSYALVSFGNNARNFGSGGFNFKVHRRIAEDFSIAAGVNGVVNVGDENGFESSFYGVATKIFRTRDDINLPLSRVAVTAGLGNGQFRSLGALRAEDNPVNVFGNIAVRLAQPVSLIAEWSGNDLGVGLSIVPFKNLPLVITPAVRDLAGAGNGARFVLGGGLLYRF